METEDERRYCQSCGIPLDMEGDEILGTNRDKSKNGEYCFYCFQNGEYTVEYPIQKVIDVWIENTTIYNQLAHTCYQPEELRRILDKRVPHLKRWKQKFETENVHYEIINRLIIYINQHLFEPLSTEHLSAIAGLSRFHFLRVFKQITGESTGKYIQRLRLQHIAHLLLSTQLSVTDITYQTNYQNKHGLTKAFQSHFGISPAAYRKEYRRKSGVVDDLPPGMRPRIRKISSMNVLYRPIDRSCRTPGTYKNIWQEMISFAGQKKLNSRQHKYLSISLDDPGIIGLDNCRFFLGMTLTEQVRPHGKFGIMTIPDGEYAVFSHRGDYSLLYKLYKDIYQMWLPQSGYRQKQTLTFEVYITTPLESDRSKLVTEVYIPIEKIQNNKQL